MAELKSWIFCHLCIIWKPRGLSKQQSEEIARGLLDGGRRFLWVIRAKEKGEEEKEDKPSFLEKLERQGMMVPWCS